MIARELNPFRPLGIAGSSGPLQQRRMKSLFRHKVLKLLLKEKRISEQWVQKLLSWKSSGFNIHNQVKIRSDDSRGRESLAQYILRSPFSQEKMTYREDTGTVLKKFFNT